MGGGIEGGSRLDRTTGEYVSPENGDGGGACPGGGGMNWGGGGGGAVEGGGGIGICSSSGSSIEMALPFDKLAVLPVHGGNTLETVKNPESVSELLQKGRIICLCIAKVESSYIKHISNTNHTLSVT